MLSLTPHALRQHIAAGVTYTEIAGMYGLTLRQVTRRAAAHGITTESVLGRRRSGRVTKLPDSDFLGMLVECGMSDVEIGNMYSATVRAVRDALQRAGYHKGDDGKWRLSKRRCVNCRDPFNSTGPGNVVCSSCKEEFV